MKTPMSSNADYAVVKNSDSHRAECGSVLQSSVSDRHCQLAATTSARCEEKSSSSFWNSPTGKAVRLAQKSGANPLNDPEMGWQREED